jgi:hypothetical protein
MYARWSVVFLLGMVAGISALVGCGGGGGGGGATPTPSTTPTPTPTPGGRLVAVSFTVDWPGRSRALTPPVSARSLRLLLSGGTGTLTVAANRRTTLEAYSETYRSTETIAPGRRTASVEFFADPDAAGAVVATGVAEVTIADDGMGIGTIALTGAIRTVEVTPGQGVAYGQRKDLSFAARSASGALLALSPGSAFATVTAGTERLRLARGIEAEGLRPGTAQVSVTVDGIASPAVPVEVTSEAQVTVSPGRVEVGAGMTVGFTGGTIGAVETGLDWSAPNGGAIGSDGTFTAPNTVGEFPVIVTSRWDPTKRAQATAVVVPRVSVAPSSVTTTLRKTANLSASVLGPPDTSVRWSVTEAGGGTVSTSGVYTAPATPGVFHVVAESVADPRQKATVTVTVQSGNGNITIQ